MTVERVQVDNQLPNAVHPTLVAGVPLASAGGTHWLQCQLSRRTTEKRLRNIDVDAKRLIALDEPFLVAMYHLSSGAAKAAAAAVAPGGGRGRRRPRAGGAARDREAGVCRAPRGARAAQAAVVHR